ncbi:MAG TPA: 1-deoxy-D-xylulose-5-phosphate reductoisomerase [Terriglobales bacterium]|nr:1-deoxy-D-xylulose-5-phosphate reductoisomerase [Terriglobales bacterium]
MSTTKRRGIALLGSTGSIGRSGLDVIGSLPQRLRAVALAAGTNAELMAEQAARFRPRLIAMATPAAAAEVAALLRARRAPVPEVLHGPEGLRAVATHADADMVLAATVGVTALPAIFAAVEAGRDIALANKEALVVAGGLLLGRARATGAAILPVDSEHSAVHQCLRSGSPREVERITLTASGGPLLRVPAHQLEAVTPEQALRHPTWSMGTRISLDSATLMNKGFEVIEACWLFGLGEDRVEVLVHQQSILHSMVEFVDGSVIAQLGPPDMRIPIQYALTYPIRIEAERNRLKLEEISRLEFERPDVERFPCLGLARAAWRAGGVAAVALNAADEVALAGYVQRKLRFTAIAPIIEETMAAMVGQDWSPEELNSILAADAEARRLAEDLLKRHAL